ncbi:hypothetical protein ACOIOJ_004355 [Salmonella enterica]
MSKKVESLAMAKRRAQLVVDILVNNACGRNDPVLMMGHGIMNRLIAKELTLRGWKKTSVPEKDTGEQAYFSFRSIEPQVAFHNHHYYGPHLVLNCQPNSFQIKSEMEVYQIIVDYIFL